MENLPETIKTNLIGTKQFFEIPISSEIEFAKRRKIVLEAYDILIKKHGGRLVVHNDFLGCDVVITRKVSRKKASNNSVRN